MQMACIRQIGRGANCDPLRCRWRRSADPQLFAGADDTKCNFAAIRDQDFSKHKFQRERRAKRGWPYSTGWPLETRRFTTFPCRIGLNFIHEFHRFDDAEDLAVLDLVSNLHESRRARRGRLVEGADDGGLEDVKSGVFGRRHRCIRGKQRRRRTAGAVAGSGPQLPAATDAPGRQPMKQIQQVAPQI